MLFSFLWLETLCYLRLLPMLLYTFSKRSAPSTWSHINAMFDSLDLMLSISAVLSVLDFFSCRKAKECNFLEIFKIWWIHWSCLSCWSGCRRLVVFFHVRSFRLNQMCMFTNCIVCTRIDARTVVSSLKWNIQLSLYWVHGTDVNIVARGAATLLRICHIDFWCTQ